MSGDKPKCSLPNCCGRCGTPSLLEPGVTYYNRAGLRFYKHVPERRVNLRRLSPEQKRRLWAWLQENRPETAEWLQDTNVQEIMRIFDGEPLLLAKDLPKEFW